MGENAQAEAASQVALLRQVARENCEKAADVVKGYHEASSEA